MPLPPRDDVSRHRAAEIAALTFSGTWRRYQQMALGAFEQQLSHGSRRTYIVAPPGSGKTLLGMEMVRRLGTRALVLVPNSALQGQWLQAAQDFAAPPGLAAASESAPIACLTYQSLCQLEDPSAAIGSVARQRWAAERAKATGASMAEVESLAGTWTGAAAERRKRELARITATLKREIARAEHGSVQLGDLLTATVRERIRALRSGGVATVVLDECHHLASMWGYVIRAVLSELGDVHVIGLTATPPDSLTTDEEELINALLGPVGFTIPVPALVRERFLAPYQELAWLTRPLDSETAWLSEHDLRFTELITAVHAGEDGVSSLPEWVIARVRERRSDGAADENAAETWAGFQKRHPALARAGARFLATGGSDLPAGIPRGEGYREPPGLDDWLVLLEDYALRCLAASPAPAASARYDQIAATLRELGFALTRQGIRRGGSDVDRLLMNSGAKSIALADVVACEFDARGDRLRALVLTDAEAAAAPESDLAQVLRPNAGSAPAAVQAIAADPRIRPLRPLLVSGRGLRCAEDDADALLAALREHCAEPLTDWRTEPAGDGLVRLLATGPAWQSRLWVRCATEIFAAGVTRILVGTRAMLGEGWDAPCVNCLIDLTAATTSTSVTQMRGRALRLDPADPDKIASNWDIICAAPELTRGTGDYERFVRKHQHLFAPSEDGVLEAGPSHVHPALGPFAPPADSMFGEVNLAMAGRAAEHEVARDRWCIGQPYIGSERSTLLVRPARQAARPAHEPGSSGPGRPPKYRISQRVQFGLAGCAVLIAALALIGGGRVVATVAAVLAVICAGWAAARLASTRRNLGDVLPLDLAAHVVCDAYLKLGELSEAAAGSLAIEPRASGYLRCFLRDGKADECERFASALDDVIAPAGFPRYLVSRLVPGEAAWP
ncbi:MAG: DEAD/DEAH box helicase family protein, partial [Nocardiopsaceae bacterium]|nr:DEAD/DEAH box helicase family protein [Nocardiopsaceae bacterium]